MNPYLETVLAFIYYFVYASLTVLRWVTYPLTPIWYLLYVFALPFIYIGQFLSSAATYPARKLPGSTVEVYISFSPTTQSITCSYQIPNISIKKRCLALRVIAIQSLSLSPSFLSPNSQVYLHAFGPLYHNLINTRPSTSISQQPPSLASSLDWASTSPKTH